MAWLNLTTWLNHRKNNGSGFAATQQNESTTAILAISDAKFPKLKRIVHYANVDNCATCAKQQLRDRYIYNTGFPHLIPRVRYVTFPLASALTDGHGHPREINLSYRYSYTMPYRACSYPRTSHPYRGKGRGRTAYDSAKTMIAPSGTGTTATLP